MPRVSQAHRLFGPLLIDVDETDVPADDEVLTFDLPSRKWRAEAPVPGGVTDHGLLDGLGDDDHPHYALADKSRPSPWVAAADLASRSIADLGTRDHHLLAGLSDDDHSIYALLTGRSGGQKLVGGLAASEHLYLYSTSHFTKGYISACDDLQLLSNILRDSGGNARLTLATASPHLRHDGDTRLEGMVAIKSAPSQNRFLNINPNLGTFTTLQELVYIGPSSGTMDANTSFRALSGLALLVIASGRTAQYVEGLFYLVGVLGPGDVTQAYGVRARICAQSFTGTISDAAVFKATAPQIMFGTPTITRNHGLLVDNQGHAAVGTAYGVRILNQTGATTNCCLEVGPATPFCRVEGGDAPTGVNSKLVVNFGGTLYRLTRNATTGAVETAAI